MIPAIFGVSGTTLNDDERAFLRAHDPLGIILFARNVESPAQLRALNDDIRSTLDRATPCVWVDQEGGRVQRMTAPHWEKLPAAGAIAEVYSSRPDDAEYAAFLLGRIIADQSHTAGFDIVCAPVLDLTIDGAHQIIGDRAFGAAPGQVAHLAGAMAEGLLQGGVVPVSKHWPGHGRATVDSHHDLPVVGLPRDDLEAADFDAFRQAANCAPIAMTGHLVFPAIDADFPATLSAAVIDQIIRGHCGFDGFLVSDDLDMKALQGDRGTLARAALDAGCDGVLQCSGDFATMVTVAEALDPMSDEAEARWLSAVSGGPDIEPADRSQLIAELRDTLASV